MSDELPPPSDELNELFRAARREAPGAAGKAAARAALGLPTMGVASVPKPVSPTAPVATSAAVSTALKAVLVLGLAGAAYTVGVRVGEERAKTTYEALPPKTVVVEVPVAAPILEVAPAPGAVAVDAGVVPKPKVRVDTPSADDLPAELLLLDEAKRAINEKKASAALEALTTYDTRFPRGAMRVDAQLLRLEALLIAGRRADAESLAKKVAASTSSELVRERVKRLLDAH